LNSSLTISNDNNDSKKVVYNDSITIIGVLNDKLNSKFYKLLSLKLDYIEENNFFGIEFYYLDNPNDESNKYFCIATISDANDDIEKQIKQLINSKP